MKKLLATLTAITLLTTVAFAQNPRDLRIDLFEYLIATQISCDSMIEHLPVIGDYDPAYCGFINDTYTSVNQEWTVETFNDHGLIDVDDAWTAGFYSGAEMYAMPFANAHQAWVAALFVIPSEDATIIVIGRVAN